MSGNIVFCLSILLLLLVLAGIVALLRHIDAAERELTHKRLLATLAEAAADPPTYTPADVPEDKPSTDALGV
jgi:hypothetical protein